MNKFKIEVETKAKFLVPYSQQPSKSFTSMIEMERRTTKLSTTLVNKTLTVETADQISGDTKRTSAGKSFLTEPLLFKYIF